MTSLETLNTLSELTVARNPKWKEQDNFATLPTDVDDGSELDEASPRCMVAVQMRENLEYRKSRVTISVLDDNGEDYSVQLEGTSSNTATETYTTSGGDTKADVINNLETQINNNGTVNGDLTANAVDTDGDGSNDQLNITGDQVENFYITTSTGSGSGEINNDADAIKATTTIYGLPRGEDKVPGEFFEIPNGSYSVDRKSFIERVDTAGFKRIYQHVQVDTGVTLDPGAPFAVKNGPAVEEGEL